MKMIIFQSLGGLGLFLFGMKIMSEGLQRIAGNRMRKILGIVSNNRLVGCGIDDRLTDRTCLIVVSPEGFALYLTV